MIAIDWSRIAEALTFYQRRGFKYVETPWVVSYAATKATFPVTEENPEPLGLTSGDVPVGSAEQGFIELMIQGKLKPGKYVSAGPCFRPQDAEKPYHQGQFFKIELIQLFSPGIYDFFGTSSSSFALIEHAKEYFAWEGVSGAGKLITVRTADGFDLELNGLEIGSYGARTFKDFTWQYGTGLAEPRFTQALEKAERTIRMSTERPTNKELHLRMKEARQKVRPYRFSSYELRAVHTKTGNLYRIEGLAYVKATLDIVVMYTTDYDTYQVPFSCPLDEFLEKFKPYKDPNALSREDLKRHP